MANSPPTPTPESFSSRYALVSDAEVRTWTEDEAHMDHDLYDLLARRYGEPVVGYVGGLHYAFLPSTQVLSNTVAVPKRQSGGQSPSALLIQK